MPRDYEPAQPRASVRSRDPGLGAPRPRPAPAPVFHRQAPVAPQYPQYQSHQSHDPYAQSQHSHHSYAPPAPNSLAPVEMNAYAQQHPRNFPTDRGVAHTSTNNIRPRPSMRTGAMILLAGVFVGGTFGIGVQARRNAMDEQANIAAAAANVAPPATQTLAAAAPGPTALQQTPPQAPPQAYAQAPANAGLPPGAIVLPPQQGVVVVPAPPQLPPQAGQANQTPATGGAIAQNTPPAKQPRITWRAPAPPPVRPTGPTIAAKVTPPPAPAVKKEAPAKADPPADPPAEPKETKKGGKKGASDAQKLLQDAIGETTNTL